MNFGSYQVPVTFVVGVTTQDSMSVSMKFRRHSFYIKKSGSKQSQASSQVESTKKILSITDKIKQLKALLDDGLINKDEYNKKKQQLLKDL